MTTRTPAGRSRQAILFIEEEGAQFVPSLVNKLGITRNHVKSLLRPWVDSEVLGVELRRCRVRGRVGLYYLGPNADECIQRIRSKEGHHAQ